MSAGRLRLALRDIGRTPKDYAQQVRLYELTTRREEKFAVWWELAVAYWLAGEQALARRCARKYVNTRPRTDIDKLYDSTRQRLRNALTRRKH